MMTNKGELIEDIEAAVQKHGMTLLNDDGSYSKELMKIADQVIVAAKFPRVWRARSA